MLKSGRQVWLSLFIVFLMMLPGCGTQQPITDTKVKNPAPDFSLPAYGSTETYTLSQLRGQPVVINFWSVT